MGTCLHENGIRIIYVLITHLYFKNIFDIAYTSPICYMCLAIMLQIYHIHIIYKISCHISIHVSPNVTVSVKSESPQTQMNKNRRWKRVR